MEKFFSYFWTLIVFASIGWYVFLLIYVGIKGGIEIPPDDPADLRSASRGTFRGPGRQG